MDITNKVELFWNEFLQVTGCATDTPLHDVFHFCDTQELATQLADLVMRGEKTATASLLWEYEVEEAPVPAKGDLSVVTDWHGIPLCVIQTTEVNIREFQEVDAKFAADEGEGDRTLEYWRNVHWAFFEQVCAKIGRVPVKDMLVICQRFRLEFVVERPADRA